MTLPTRCVPPRERGAALILAFLALMVLVVVVGQLTVSSAIEKSIANNTVKDIQYEGAAVGAFEIAKSLLMRDLKDEQSASEGEDAAGGDSGFSGGGFGSGGQTGGGGGAQGEESPADTLLDLWADEGETTQQFGEGVEVRIRMIDEDRKLNLLTLVAEDEDFREAFKDRLIRLLDTFREDSRHDLTYGDAQDIAKNIEEWLTGERPKDVPRYAASTDEKDDSGKVFSDDVWTKGEGEEIEVVFPLTMEELLHVDEMSEFILKGFMEDGRYVPGLEDVCTIYSNLVFDEARFDEDDEEGEDVEDFQSPFDDDEEDAGSADEEQEADEDGKLVATETNHGRVNVNTAPLAVLRALLPNERLSTSVVDRIDEFRKNAWDEDVVSRAKAFQGHFADEGDGEEQREDEADDTFGSDQKDFTFSSPDEVIDKVQDYFKARFDVEEDANAEFSGLLAVKSHVFTVLLEMRRTDGQSSSSIDRATEWVPPDRIYRAVVWRRASEDGKGECITVVPLHLWTGVVPPDTEDYREEFPFGF